MTAKTPIVRTLGANWARAFHGRHPFNPRSEMRMIPLSDPAGMSRLGASLIRLPPGKESFIPHAHTLSEEFVFVLEGTGDVVLDGVAHPIGPGDFIGFPTDGVVHSLVCSGPLDLVYLTAGERTPVEVADMPTIGRTAVFRRGGMELLEAGSGETLTQAEWMARTRINSQD